MTPEDLFRQFRKLNVHHSYQTLLKFNRLSNEEKGSFLEPTMDFVNTEVNDRIRCWGTSVLEFMGGEKALNFLIGLIEKADADEKIRYRWTRFYALRGILRIALSENKLGRLLSICEKVANDKVEKGPIVLASKAVLSKYGKKTQRRVFEEELNNCLENIDKYSRTMAVLRALREFPSPVFADKLLAIMRNKHTYHEVRHTAIAALGSLGPDVDIRVLRGLGEVIVSELDRYLRLEAVISLRKLGNSAAQRDILQAVERDEDAEIKVQSSEALVEILGKSEAVLVIVQEALTRGLEEPFRDNLVEALRKIDPDRAVASEILGKELAGEDQERVQIAEKILLDLGGWAALQNISQRRSTLNYTDKLLRESEQVVQKTFQSTMRQARLNFFFAMGVNIAVVIIGIVLIGIAVNQLIQQPEKLESWVIPGGTGLIGVILNIAFNNPRHNAREDLGTLLNVNILFLGFLRQLNEIDATFKHAYLENPDFDFKDMQVTVNQIRDAMNKTLANGAYYLQPLKSRRVEKVNQPE